MIYEEETSLIRTQFELLVVDKNAKRKMAPTVNTRLQENS